MAIVIFDLHDLQDEKHPLFLRKCWSVCAVGSNYAHLFFEAPPQTRITLGAYDFYLRPSIQKSKAGLRQDSNQLYFFISVIMDAFCEPGRDQQAEQPNHLVKPPCNLA
eukprot:1144835-Pelagomonas_calceolata.AAC.2